MKKTFSIFAIVTLALLNFLISSLEAEAQFNAAGQYCSDTMRNQGQDCSFPGASGLDLPGQQNQPPVPVDSGNQPPIPVDSGNQPATPVDSGNQGGGDSTYKIKLTNPLKSGTNNLFDFIKLIVNNVLLPIGGVVATMYIIYSGFLFVTAMGDPKKIETAKASFTYAVIGTAILLGAWAISEGIAATIRQLVN